MEYDVKKETVKDNDIATYPDVKYTYKDKKTGYKIEILTDTISRNIWKEGDAYEESSSRHPISITHHRSEDKWSNSCTVEMTILDKNDEVISKENIDHVSSEDLRIDALENIRHKKYKDNLLNYDKNFVETYSKLKNLDPTIGSIKKLGSISSHYDSLIRQSIAHGIFEAVEKYEDKEYSEIFGNEEIEFADKYLEALSKDKDTKIINFRLNNNEKEKKEQLKDMSFMTQLANKFSNTK